MSYGSKLHISPTNCHFLAVQQVIQNRLSLWETLWIIFWGEVGACTVNEHTAESFVITMVMEKAEKLFQAIMYYPQWVKEHGSFFFFLFVLFYSELPDSEPWPHKVYNHWSHKDPSRFFFNCMQMNSLPRNLLVSLWPFIVYLFSLEYILV